MKMFKFSAPWIWRKEERPRKKKKCALRSNSIKKAPKRTKTFYFFWNASHDIIKKKTFTINLRCLEWSGTISKTTCVHRTALIFERELQCFLFIFSLSQRNTTFISIFYTPLRFLFLLLQHSIEFAPRGNIITSHISRKEILLDKKNFYYLLQTRRREKKLWHCAYVRILVI